MLSLPTCSMTIEECKACCANNKEKIKSLSNPKAQDVILAALLKSATRKMEKSMAKLKR